MIRPVLAYDSENEITFGSIVECAKYFKVTKDTMLKHVHGDQEIQGYFLVLLDPVKVGCPDDGDCDNCSVEDCCATQAQLTHYESRDFGRQGRPYLNEKRAELINDEYSEVKRAEKNIYD